MLFMYICSFPMLSAKNCRWPHFFKKQSTCALTSKSKSLAKGKQLPSPSPNHFIMEIFMKPISHMANGLYELNQMKCFNCWAVISYSKSIKINPVCIRISSYIERSGLPRFTIVICIYFIFICYLGYRPATRTSTVLFAIVI